MENHSDLILKGYLTKDENSVLIYSPSQTFIPKLWNGVFSIHWKMVGMKIVSKKSSFPMFSKSLLFCSAEGRKSYSLEYKR